jgi:hypothetical protein
MSRASALAAIDHALTNNVPAIHRDIFDKDELDSTADANDAHTAMLRLKGLREEKAAAYKEIEDRLRDDKKATLDTLDEQIYKLDTLLTTYAKPRLEGRHLDLPAGRIQFGSSHSIVVKCDENDLQKKLKKLYKAHPNLVSVELKLKKREAIKAMTSEGDPLQVDFLGIATTDSVSYSGDTTSEPKKAKAPKPSRKERPSAESEVAPPASGVDTSKGPRIFEVPDASHFSDERSDTKKKTFYAFDIGKLLANQNRVTVEHIESLPIEKIKGGITAMTEKLGMGKPEVRIWVAYHTGATPDTVDPGKFDDEDWRRLLALAVHAHTVKEKHSAEG